VDKGKELIPMDAVCRNNKEKEAQDPIKESKGAQWA
jgi:hypothetical protein